jgi:hypothetical protein
MPRATTLPFQISRSNDAFEGGTVTSTAEKVHGLLSLKESQLTVEWRLERTVNTVGRVIREDREMEAVRQVTVPITGIASAVLRASRWPWSRASRLVLTAADLHSFESISGPVGLRLEHPAQLILEIRPADRTAAQEFAADVEMALADQAMKESTALPRDAERSAAPAIIPMLPATSHDRPDDDTRDVPPR